MKIVHVIALIWGLIGAFSFNLVDFLFGAGSVLSRIVYGLVGISGLWCFTLIPRVLNDD